MKILLADFTQYGWNHIESETIALSLIGYYPNVTGESSELEIHTQTMTAIFRVKDDGFDGILLDAPIDVAVNAWFMATSLNLRVFIITEMKGDKITKVREILSVEDISNLILQEES